MKTLVTDLPERADFVSGNRTLEIGYPWLTPGAIMALELLLTKDFKVLELGSGGSTVFWASRCKSVRSFETDAQWWYKVGPFVEKYGNARLTHGDMYRILDEIKAEPDGHYDLALSDSSPYQSDRLALTNAIVPKIRPGGWLVIDNYDFFGMERFDYGGWKTYTFDDFSWVGKGTRICQIEDVVDE